MRADFWAVTMTIKGLTRILCRVDDSQLARVPQNGPLILVCNHINFLDIPLVFTHLQPRPLTGFAKSETWDNPAMGYLFDLWGAIPIRRGEADLGALRRGLQALEDGQILAIAPEGTRSNHGCLGSGHPGVVTLALRSGAPILPLAYYGGENFHKNFAQLKRTDFHIVVGQPFYLRSQNGRVTGQTRQEMLDEIMYQLAALLPPENRGVYSDLSQASQSYLCFPEASKRDLSYIR